MSGNCRDASRSALRSAVQGIDQRAIVRAVAGRLDDDIALEAEKVTQRTQMLLRASQGVYLRSGA